MQNILLKVFSIKANEFKLFMYAMLFIFSVFASYALLRPIRDALGLHGGQEELKWLFLATFIATLLASLIAMYFSGVVKRRAYINLIYVFFTLNLLGFYIALLFIDEHHRYYLMLCRIFYVWVSVFNMFIISSAWSLLADIFNKDNSQRLFGLISAGASCGSIAGAFSVSVLGRFIGIDNFVFASIALLLFAIWLKNALLKEGLKLVENKIGFEERFNKPLESKNPFVGFSLIIRSKYLLALLAFIVLLTSVSTFLYMEQARIIKELFPTKEARAAAFANIDLIVQILSFVIQIFFTAKIAQYFGIKSLLSLIGFVLSLGFIALIFTHPAFLPLVIVMSIRRIGEYALVKPGREMLFVPLDSEGKYKVKNFLDTVVYRGGDALSAQLEGALLKLGVSAVLLGGAVMSFLWGILGLYLGRRYNKERGEE